MIVKEGITLISKVENSNSPVSVEEAHGVIK